MCMKSGAGNEVVEKGKPSSKRSRGGGEDLDRRRREQEVEQQRLETDQTFSSSLIAVWCDV
eukprot:783845-Rhodomonas_salina.1